MMDIPHHSLVTVPVPTDMFESRVLVVGGDVVEVCPVLLQVLNIKDRKTNIPGEKKIHLNSIKGSNIKFTLEQGYISLKKLESWGDMAAGEKM